MRGRLSTVALIVAGCSQPALTVPTDFDEGWAVLSKESGKQVLLRALSTGEAARLLVDEADHVALVPRSAFALASTRAPPPLDGVSARHRSVPAAEGHCDFPLFSGYGSPQLIHPGTTTPLPNDSRVYQGDVELEGAAAAAVLDTLRLEWPGDCACRHAGDVEVERGPLRPVGPSGWPARTLTSTGGPVFAFGRRVSRRYDPDGTRFDGPQSEVGSCGGPGFDVPAIGSMVLSSGLVLVVAQVVGQREGREVGARFFWLDPQSLEILGTAEGAAMELRAMTPVDGRRLLLMGSASTGLLSRSVVNLCAADEPGSVRCELLIEGLHPNTAFGEVTRVGDAFWIHQGGVFAFSVPEEPSAIRKAGVVALPDPEPIELRSGERIELRLLLEEDGGVWLPIGYAGLHRAPVCIQHDTPRGLEHELIRLGSEMEPESLGSCGPGECQRVIRYRGEAHLGVWEGDTYYLYPIDEQGLHCDERARFRGEVAVHETQGGVLFSTLDYEPLLGADLAQLDEVPAPPRASAVGAWQGDLYAFGPKVEVARLEGERLVSIGALPTTGEVLDAALSDTGGWLILVEDQDERRLVLVADGDPSTGETRHVWSGAQPRHLAWTGDRRAIAMTASGKRIWHVDLDAEPAVSEASIDWDEPSTVGREDYQDHFHLAEHLVGFEGGAWAMLRDQVLEIDDQGARRVHLLAENDPVLSEDGLRTTEWIAATTRCAGQGWMASPGELLDVRSRSNRTLELSRDTALPSPQHRVVSMSLVPGQSFPDVAIHQAVSISFGALRTADGVLRPTQVHIEEVAATAKAALVRDGQGRLLISSPCP